jgi:hypothetical protein
MTEAPGATRSLGDPVPVRFPESLASAARQLAEQDGMTMSAWVRRIVDRELAAREGVCHSCGLPVPRESAGLHQ